MSVFIAFILRANRVLFPLPPDTTHALRVFRVFSSHLARTLQKGRFKTCTPPPPSVRMV